MDNDDIFDNGIDGEPFDSPADDYYDDYEDSGFVIYRNKADNTQIIYYSGQWNDSGVDPDRILVRCDIDNFGDAKYYVCINIDRVWIKTPEKHFDMDVVMKLSDFVDIESPIEITPNRTSISEMTDLLSDKKIKITFDKEKFKARLERLRNLLVFT
jgi:hypothetical protein